MILRCSIGLAQRAGSRLHLLRVRLHPNRFGYSAELQSDGGADGRVYGNDHTLLLIALKTARSRSEVVRAGRQERKKEPAVGGAGRFPFQTGGLGSGREFCPCDYGAGRVHHFSSEGTGGVGRIHERKEGERENQLHNPNSFRASIALLVQFPHV